MTEEITPHVKHEAPDFGICNKYCKKVLSSADRGIDFTLTLAQFKALMTKKRCHYTGMVLSDGDGENRRFERTLDRIDADKGYTKENTVACSRIANNFKAMYEHPGNPEFNFKEAMKLMTIVKKELSGKKEN